MQQKFIMSNVKQKNYLPKIKSHMVLFFSTRITRAKCLTKIMGHGLFENTENNYKMKKKSLCLCMFFFACQILNSTIFDLKQNGIKNKNQKFQKIGVDVWFPPTEQK